MKKYIKVTKDGPFEVSGKIPLDKQVIKTDDQGYPLSYEKIKQYKTDEKYYLCRCGNSKNKPFCDGSHITGFDGKENAGHSKYLERAEKKEGENLILYDDNSLCSGAGFCYGKEGNAWFLSGSKDKVKNDLAIKQCCNCSSGRLTVFDKKTKLFIEPKFKPNISILFEPWKDVGSSIWVKGNIPIISENNEQFETRNRVTLCRCGRSANKPFCDSTHRYDGFKDDEKK